MNTSYVQIRNELASEQLIKVQFQVAMSGRYIGYGAKHSTSLSLIHLINKITSAINEGQVRAVVFLDLSKAFDT